MSIRRLLFAFNLIWGMTLHAAPPTFFAEWRLSTNARLAVLMPKGAYARRGHTGVSITNLAAALGVSVARASLLLSSPDHHLDEGHANRLAARFEIKAEFILALELFDRFTDLRALDAAIASESAKDREFLIGLYLRRRDQRHPVAGSTSPEGRDFVTRWRAEVKRRLAGLMPGALCTPDRPSVNVRVLSRVIRRSESVALTIVCGRQYLTYEYARLIAAQFGRTPEWVAAVDMLNEFTDAIDLERAMAGERARLRGELRRLHALRSPNCLHHLGHSGAESGTHLAQGRR